MPDELARREEAVEALTRLLLSKPELFKPDKESVETDQLCLDGSRFKVPVAEKDKTFDQARDALVLPAAKEGRVLGQRTVTRSSGFVERHTEVEEVDGKGAARTVTVTERLDAEGNVKALVETQGQARIDKQAALGVVMGQATHGPWYHGRSLNGSIYRPIKALQEDAENFRFRVLSATWDQARGRVVASKPIHEGPWKAAYNETTGRPMPAWVQALREYSVNRDMVVDMVPTADGDTGGFGAHPAQATLVEGEANA